MEIRERLKDLPKWFVNRIIKVMEHNGYTSEMITVDVCNEKDKWTPCDLILREYYNNGGGSAKGFLGITRTSCIKCYNYIKEHQAQFKELGLYNEKGWNNFGFTLWTNYNLH